MYRPPTYPDGFYWIGVTESGRSGLFLPSNTVAHIGVDYPKLPANFGLLRSNNSASATNSPKNQRKLDKKSLISAPTNAQHIEHIGWDDTHSGMNSPNPSLRSNTITPRLFFTIFDLKFSNFRTHSTTGQEISTITHSE